MWIDMNIFGSNKALDVVGFASIDLYASGGLGLNLVEVHFIPPPHMTHMDLCESNYI